MDLVVSVGRGEVVDGLGLPYELEDSQGGLEASGLQSAGSRPVPGTQLSWLSAQR